MARAYSLDLRERVAAAVAAGESCRKFEATFKVSVASVVKRSERFLATGNPGGAADRRQLALCAGWATRLAAATAFATSQT